MDDELQSVTGESADNFPVHQNWPAGWDAAEQFVGGQILEGDDGFGVIPQAWEETAALVFSYLEAKGMAGQKLATQADDSVGLLKVVLADLKIRADGDLDNWLLGTLVQKIHDATETDHLAKRLRGDRGSHFEQRVRDSLFARGQTTGGSSASATSPEVCFPARGRLRISVDKLDTAQRTDRDRQQLEKWHGLLVDYLIEGEVPGLELAKRTADTRRTLVGFAGKTRCGTLKSYLKHWGRFRLWAITQVGTPWPRDIEVYIDYLFVLAEQPCACSVPQVTLQSMNWMEKVAGFTTSGQISKQPMFVQTLEAVTLMVAGVGVPVRKAPRFPAVVLASMALYVKDSSFPKLWRFHLGGVLFRCWATLRFDDAQHIFPQKLRRIGDTVVTELMRSKTSGAGKRNRELPIAVSIQACVINSGWMGVWLQLLESLDLGDVDYLVPAIMADGQKFSRRAMTYAESSALTQKILSTLMVPVHTASTGWIASSTSLKLLAIRGCWPEHSPRSVMPSYAAILEREKDKRDMLGRWSAGGSDDYNRCFRVVVVEMQLAVGRALRKGAGLNVLHEADITDSLIRFLVERRGFTKDAAITHTASFNSCMSNFLSKLAEVGEDDTVELISDETLPLFPSLPVNSTNQTETEFVQPTAKAGVRKVVERNEKYLISYSKGRVHAKLHLAKGGCVWANSELLDFAVFTEVTPNLYDSRCKFCWPSKAPVTEAESTESETSSDDGGAEE